MPLIEFLSQAFVTLLVIIDPFAVIPVFVGLTGSFTAATQKRTARRCTWIALALLLTFAIVGDKLLDIIGISEPAFRIAGGFLLLLAAVDMVISRGEAMRAQNSDEAREISERDDVSVFPLAIPLIAGPGALTSVVVLMRQAQEHSYIHSAGVLGLIIIVVGVVYAGLQAAPWLMRLLGLTGMNVLTRVFGILLSAIAIENMIRGVLAVIKMSQG